MTDALALIGVVLPGVPRSVRLGLAEGLVHVPESIGAAVLDVVEHGEAGGGADEAGASPSLRRFAILRAALGAVIGVPLVRRDAGVRAALGLDLALILVDPRELGRAAILGGIVHGFAEVGGVAGTLRAGRGGGAILHAPLVVAGLEVPEVGGGGVSGPHLREGLAEVLLVPLELVRAAVGDVVEEGDAGPVGDHAAAGGGGGVGGTVHDAAFRGGVVAVPAGRAGGLVVLAGGGGGLADVGAEPAELGGAAGSGVGVELDGRAVEGARAGGGIGVCGAILDTGIFLIILIPQSGIRRTSHSIRGRIAPALAIFLRGPSQLGRATFRGGIIQRVVRVGAAALVARSGTILHADISLHEPLVRRTDRRIRLRLAKVGIEGGELGRTALGDGIVHRNVRLRHDPTAGRRALAILHADVLGVIEVILPPAQILRAVGDGRAIILLVPAEVRRAAFRDGVVGGPHPRAEDAPAGVAVGHGAILRAALGGLRPPRVPLVGAGDGPPAALDAVGELGVGVVSGAAVIEGFFEVEVIVIAVVGEEEVVCGCFVFVETGSASGGPVGVPETVLREGRGGEGGDDRG
mmetsp:Transcript_27875/g.47392  ORF Transcript_27875/g.47392 Transcript_27875/m.47392 type:complete len:578 (-) Transcript_27875:139-1872(-)